MASEPRGPEIFDHTTGRLVKLAMSGPYEGWLLYKHADGQWVTYRKATRDDRDRINRAYVRALTRSQ